MSLFMFANGRFNSLFGLRTFVAGVHSTMLSALYSSNEELDIRSSVLEF